MSNTYSGIYGGDPYGSNGFGEGYYKSLGANPWASIIDVPRGKEHLYRNMPIMGGKSSIHPGTVYDPATGHDVEIYYKHGKKLLKRVKHSATEKKKVTREEATETPDKMFEFLKQYNKAADKKYEEEELKAYLPEDDDV
jgi:hypothetical protein